MRKLTNVALVLLTVSALACGSDPSSSDAVAEDDLSTSTNVLFSDNFERYYVRNWSDGSTHGQWTSVFNGYGANGIQRESSTNKVLSLGPLASTDPSESHAGLVTSIPSFGDLDLTLRAKTVKQLRTPTPNPWEVAWLLWHLTDTTHFYALVLKPNGWELDKEDPAYPGAQRFLATGSSPTFDVGAWNKVRIVQVGGTIDVYVNGAKLTSFTDTERPYLSGSIGAYTEDAQAWFDDVAIVAPSSTADGGAADSGSDGADAGAADSGSDSADAAIDSGNADASTRDSGGGGAGTYLYGVTVDDISNLSGVVASLKALPKRATARIVFDEGQSPSYYANAVPAIHDVSYVMGEILDSAYVKNVTVAQYTSRTSDYLAAFPSNVDIWEVGNEINGNWLGATSDVAAKMTGAFDLVKAAGKRTELTLYGCSDSGAQYDMFNWVKANVPSRMLTGLDYVLVSYYEGDCGNPRSDWQSVFDQLHTLFPNSSIGFGEVGATDSNGNDITDPSIAGPYLQKYYGMSITTPRYVGGYFWWYFAEDMVPTTKTMFSVLSNAIQAMP